MVQEFGLPKTSNRLYEEIFGWYHVMDETCYWSFHPTTQVWDVKVSDQDRREDYELTVPQSPLWSETERLDLEEKLKALAYLPQPFNPKKKGKWLSRAPFLFEGWLFAWTYNVVRERWRISPIGRP